MNAAQLIALLLEILQLAPYFAKAGVDVVGFIATTVAAVQNMQDEDRDPTDEELADLKARIDALRVQLHAD